MGNHLELELRRLAADMRDDVARSKYLGRASIGLWALMAYEQRIEQLLDDLHHDHRREAKEQ